MMTVGRSLFGSSSCTSSIVLLLWRSCSLGEDQRGVCADMGGSNGGSCSAKEVGVDLSS